MADKKYNIDDILRIFAKLEKRIEDLQCFVKECCAKIPVNIGTGIGLYKKFNQNKWEFKSLLPGDNINISQTNNEVIISSTVQPVDCQDIKDCIGISPSGDPDKYLNEQGNWQSINLTGTPTEILYYDSLGNITSDANFYRTNVTTVLKQLGNLGVNSSINLTSTQLDIFTDASGIGDGGAVGLTGSTATFGVKNSYSFDGNFYVSGTFCGWESGGNIFNLPVVDGSNGDVLTTDGSGNLSFQTVTIPPAFIQSVSDTATVNLTVTGTDLTADFVSMNISQFTNNSGYITLGSLSAGTGISYNNLTGVITNSAPDQTVTLGTTGTGLSVTGSYPSFTIQNTLPDQTVVLTQGGTTTITGTYPNFTISSADQYTGTVTSVAALTLGTTGTDLSSTVANSTTTPVITLNVPTASASNRGALSSSDWSTFNSKIGGSGTTNELAYFSGSSTIGSLTTATYPSLTELSYVKGVTSAIQTQLDNKPDILAIQIFM